MKKDVRSSSHEVDICEILICNLVNWLVSCLLKLFVKSLHGVGFQNR